MFADGLGDRYVVVEDVLLESLERTLVLLALEPFVLSEEHPNQEDHVHALVVVFIVVFLIRDAPPVATTIFVAVAFRSTT